MFKRMSILSRRSGMARPCFADHWEAVHGPLIANLPYIRHYVQNHVVEQPHISGRQDFYLADGIVELYFDKPGDMKQAFAAPEAEAVLHDEPNFLGSAVGYHIAGDQYPLASDEQATVLVVARDLEGPVTAFLEEFRSSRHWTNEVVATVARSPQAIGSIPPVGFFIKMKFSSDKEASEALRFFAMVSEAGSLEYLADVYRVVERRIVATCKADSIVDRRNSSLIYSCKKPG